MDSGSLGRFIEGATQLDESTLHFRELKGVQIEKITGGNRLERLRRSSLGRAVFKLSELDAWLGDHAMSLEQIRRKYTVSKFPRATGSLAPLRRSSLVGSVKNTVSIRLVISVPLDDV